MEYFNYNGHSRKHMLFLFLWENDFDLDKYSSNICWVLFPSDFVILGSSCRLFILGFDHHGSTSPKTSSKSHDQNSTIFPR